jgi:hypothetical protein
MRCVSIARLRQPSTQCFQAALRPAATAAVQAAGAVTVILLDDCGSRHYLHAELLAQSMGTTPRPDAPPRYSAAGRSPTSPRVHALVELCPKRLHDLATAPARHCGGSALRLALAACGGMHSCSAAAVGATRATDAAVRPAVRCCPAPLQPPLRALFSVRDRRPSRQRHGSRWEEGAPSRRCRCCSSPL